MDYAPLFYITYNHYFMPPATAFTCIKSAECLNINQFGSSGIGKGCT